LGPEILGWVGLGFEKVTHDQLCATDPLSGCAGRPKFNQLEMVTTFTYRPSLVRIDARNSELSW